MEVATDSVKGLVPCSSVPPPVSDCEEPMDTDNDTKKHKDPEACTAKIKDDKPSFNSTTSDSTQTCPSSSRAMSTSCGDLKQEKEYKVEDVKEEENKKEDVKKRSLNETKMKLDSMKVETKTEKMEVSQATKPSRPSSTPPSDTGMIEWMWNSFSMVNLD